MTLKFMKFPADFLQFFLQNVDFFQIKKMKIIYQFFCPSKNFSQAAKI